MSLAHIVLLLATLIAVAAIAGYLIWVIIILKHVVNRLVTILGAVDAVTETVEPVGPIIDDISRDLDAGRKLLEDGVRRLEEGRGVPVGATAGGSGMPAERTASDVPAERTATGVPRTPDVDPPEPPDQGGGRSWWSR